MVPKIGFLPTTSNKRVAFKSRQNTSAGVNSYMQFGTVLRGISNSRVSGSKYSYLLNGENAYSYLNSRQSSIQTTTPTSEVNTLTGTLSMLERQGYGISSVKIGVAKVSGKSSDAILKDITNAKNYLTLNAAKSQMEANKAELVSSYNDEISSYISSSNQAVLDELGIATPELTPISGEFEQYDKDMESLTSDQSKLQTLSDNCNPKLPEISQKKATAKTKVSTLRSQKWNIHKQILAAKFSKGGKERLPELRAQLEEVKQQLVEAKEVYNKYKTQEKALKEGIKESQKKNKEIEKNKKDLTNYHEAETKIVDKTYEIARNEDTQLQEKLNKMKSKKAEIEKASQDSNTEVADSSDEVRNKKLNKLQKEYSVIALEVSTITMDLGALIKGNQGKTTVNNSKGGMYQIQHYTEAMQLLGQEQDNQQD